MTIGLHIHSTYKSKPLLSNKRLSGVPFGFQSKVLHVQILDHDTLQQVRGKMVLTRGTDRRHSMLVVVADEGGLEEEIRLYSFL